MAKPVVNPSDAAPAARVRFGLTVGKRMARRSVDRVLVKRLLREAARHAAPGIEAVASSGFDVVLRLKAPMPKRETMSRTAVKRAMRAEADLLLQRFCERVKTKAPGMGPGAAGPFPGPPPQAGEGTGTSCGA